MPPQPIRYVGPRVEDAPGTATPEFISTACEQVCEGCGARMLCQANTIEFVRSTAAKNGRGFRFCCQRCMDRIASKSKRSVVVADVDVLQMFEDVSRFYAQRT